jgi:hypothetical protein
MERTFLSLSLIEQYKLMEPDMRELIRDIISENGNIYYGARREFRNKALTNQGRNVIYMKNLQMFYSLEVEIDCGERAADRYTTINEMSKYDIIESILSAFLTYYRKSVGESTDGFKREVFMISFGKFPLELTHFGIPVCFVNGRKVNVWFHIGFNLDINLYG